MISILIIPSNHVHYKAFDHMNISKVFKNVFIHKLFFLYLLTDDVILLTKLVSDFNCKYYGK